ncbi:hypothetical protein SK571_30520 [Lentzea sp. BCCO 10_0798]|uniref:Malonyl-CoA:ACP transacylase (MAT) domain-containing protein n=1 Tax=Lentzea kristufekii TaxID=3095430 RepID=A0ABU4U070_9PSEU|nr:hypothetical protein [Lentzea sp. BCCO 10_0798]MDX8053728.1 hypothetical protein [Lentzea sp. BCCO 10_0798]
MRTSIIGIGDTAEAALRDAAVDTAHVVRVDSLEQLLLVAQEDESPVVLLDDTTAIVLAAAGPQRTYAALDLTGGPCEPDHVELAGEVSVARLTSVAASYPSSAPGKSINASPGLLAAVAHVARHIAARRLPKSALEVPEVCKPALTAAGFTAPAVTRPWLRRRKESPVTAVVDADAERLVLLGATPPAAAALPFLLVLPGNSVEEIVVAAQACLDELAAGRPAHALVEEHAGRRGQWRAALVGTDEEQLRHELSAAVRGLPEIPPGGEWATPAGSYCTTAPIGAAYRVAFVYPGGFTAYPDVAEDLFDLFPALRDQFERETAEPAQRYRLDTIHGLGLTPGPAAAMRHERALRDDLAGMVNIGLNVAVLHTRMLRDQLGLRPDGALAYSFGEASMLFALSALDFADWEPSSLDESPLVQNGISGRKDVVRQAWANPDGEVWASHVVLAGPEHVLAAIGDEDRVFLTHINTPEETVIAGDPARCAEVLARLDRSSAKSPTTHVLHSKLLDGSRQQLVDLHAHEVCRVPDAELLSMYEFGPASLPVGSTPGQRIAHTLARPVDFPRLVDAAYQRGYRYFIEVGPAASCTRWIRDTLGDRPHVAVSVDQRGVPTGLAVARALARLVCHRVPGPEPVLALQVVLAHRHVLRAHNAVQQHAVAALTRSLPDSVEPQR